MNWANLLTWSRLLAALPLTVLAWADREELFLALYIFAIATDLVDGLVARLTGTATPSGARLDGTVDLIFAAFALGWLWMLRPALYTEYWPFLLIVVAAFVTFATVSLAKTGRFVIPHLWSGKLAMALFALLIPVIFLLGTVSWYVHLVWIIVVLSRLEMIVFILRGGTDMDAKSIFSKRL